MIVDGQGSDRAVSLETVAEVMTTRELVATRLGPEHTLTRRLADLLLVAVQYDCPPAAVRFDAPADSTAILTTLSEAPRLTPSIERARHAEVMLHPGPHSWPNDGAMNLPTRRLVDDRGTLPTQQILMVFPASGIV